MVRNRIIIGLVLVVLLLFTSLAGLFKLYQNEKEERQRFGSNMVALIKSKSRQQELTVNELKELYPKYDSLAKELNIKTKRITNIIDTKYRFRDSIITSTVLKTDILFLDS
jgi:flagellar basal body-associated protein FliL